MEEMLKEYLWSNPKDDNEWDDWFSECLINDFTDAICALTKDFNPMNFVCTMATVIEEWAHIHNVPKEEVAKLISGFVEA